jgi:hypothetical protein
VLARKYAQRKALNATASHDVVDAVTTN